MENERRDFFLNYGNYLTKLKPQFERYFEPELIFQFGLPLPYYLPLPEKALLTYKVNSEEVCNFFFSNYKESKEIHTGFYEGKAVIVDVIKTRVEVNYAFNKDNLKNSEEGDLDFKLSEVFESALTKLNKVIEAYIAKTTDGQVYRLTKEHFDVALIYKIFNPKFNHEITKGLFHLHLNPPNTHATPLSIPQTDEIMKYIDVVEEDLNPFLNGNEFIVNAKREFRYGNYRQAVINVQTGIEIFLYSLYREFLKQEGFLLTEIISKSEKMRFKSLIKDQISKRIGGNFDVDDSNEIVEKWWQKTYLLRNKVVHEGRYPSFSEVDDALYQAMEFLNYIVKLIHTKENKDNYPELPKYIKDSQTLEE